MQPHGRVNILSAESVLEFLSHLRGLSTMHACPHLCMEQQEAYLAGCAPGKLLNELVGRLSPEALNVPVMFGAHGRQLVAHPTSHFVIAWPDPHSFSLLLRFLRDRSPTSTLNGNQLCMALI